MISSPQSSNSLRNKTDTRVSVAIGLHPTAGCADFTEHDPAKLWIYYLQLVAVEEAFKNLKGDLAVRPDIPLERQMGAGTIFGGLA